MSVTLPVDVCPFSIPTTVTLEVNTVGTGGSCRASVPIGELGADEISQLCDEFRASLFDSVDLVDPNPPVAYP